MMSRKQARRIAAKAYRRCCRLVRTRCLPQSAAWAEYEATCARVGVAPAPF
jgi:hypothetical protein